jgi:phage terminase large subunit-like protein
VRAGRDKILPDAGFEVSTAVKTLTLKMEAARSFETLAFNHHTTMCNNPENHEF